MRSKYWYLVLVLLLFSGGGARAQSLQRLHITALTLSADIAKPQLEIPFHLIIQVHATERVTELDNLVLPSFPGVESMGDEQHLIGSPQGTDYREVLTVVAHRTGAIVISPAYIDAIDARDGKPKRFLSNSLTLTVAGGTLEDPFAPVRHLVATLIKIVLVAFAIFVAGLIFVRRRQAPEALTSIVLEPPSPIVPAPSLKGELREGLRQLQSAPTRAAVMRVRRILWKLTGAPEGATLADLFDRYFPDVARVDPELARVLRLTERAAFIKESHMLAAIDDLCVPLGQYVLR